MLLEKTTYQQQSLLASYTRSGDENIIRQLKGVKEKGIRYYRDLIFNIVWDGVSNAYPIMTDFLGEDKMKTLVEKFFATHKCSNPQVWAMPKEFMDYAIQNEPSLINEYPFLPDLILFEWKEIEIYMMPDKPIPAFTKKGSLWSDKMVFNPESEVVKFSYPVFMLHPDEITEEFKNEYYVLLHRDFDTKEVLFHNVSELSAKVIDVLKEQPLSYRELEKKYAMTMQQKNHIKVFLQDALEKEIILGFLKL